MEVQKNQTMETMLVKNIRESQAKITTKPIVYYWWFKKAAIVKLFSFTQLDLGKLKFKIFEGDSYVLLYVGKGKNGHARLVDYHILDNNNFHRLKTVLNGRLSSLRQTLCGLLKIQMSKGKQEINDFMDENCLVEWKCVSEENLKTTEKETIKKNYLPLNYHHQIHHFDGDYRKQLTQLKQAMRG